MEDNSIFVVYFPPDIITTSGTCAVAEGYCGIHQSDKTDSVYTFAVIPDFSTCSTVGCGLGTLLQNLQSTTTHEIVESITDPFGTNAYTGWADDQWGEIGDMCNQVTDTVGTGTVQKWYSQLTGACVTSVAVNLTGSKLSSSCNSSYPVNCYNGICCPASYSCAAGGSCTPPSNCPLGYPVACGNFCCSSGQVCYGGHCIAFSDEYGCPFGYTVDCGNGFCCNTGTVCGSDGFCHTSTNGGNCPDGYPVNCGDGYCCPAGETCSQTSSGTYCFVGNSGCTDPNYPVDCNNGYCCLPNTVCSTDVYGVTYCDDASGNNLNFGEKMRVNNLLMMILFFCLVYAF